MSLVGALLYIQQKISGPHFYVTRRSNTCASL